VRSSCSNLSAICSLQMLLKKCLVRARARNIYELAALPLKLLFLAGTILGICSLISCGHPKKIVCRSGMRISWPQRLADSLSRSADDIVSLLEGFDAKVSFVILSAGLDEIVDYS